MPNSIRKTLMLSLKILNKIIKKKGSSYKILVLMTYKYILNKKRFVIPFKYIYFRMLVIFVVFVLTKFTQLHQHNLLCKYLQNCLLYFVRPNK